MLAALRERSRSIRSSAVASATNSSSDQRAPSRQVNILDSSPDGVEGNTTSSPDSVNAMALPLPVQNLLQRVYFTCMFNSTMLFHPPTFYRQFEEGNVPTHNLLAVYAIATTCGLTDNDTFISDE